MSASKSDYLALQPKPDTDHEYDMVDYEAEIGQDGDDQRAKEGLLLQQDQPQSPRKNVYVQAVSNLMKLGKMGDNPIGETVSGPSRHLISHDIVTTLTPQLAGLFGKQSMDRSESLLSSIVCTNHILTIVTTNVQKVKNRAAKNINALEELLRKVPKGQTSLYNHINGILVNELKNREQLVEMEEWAEQLKNGQLNIKDGEWNTVRK